MQEDSKIVLFIVYFPSLIGVSILTVMNVCIQTHLNSIVVCSLLVIIRMSTGLS